MSGVSGTFNIPASNKEWFEKQIAKLSRKSVRLLGEQFAIKPFYFGPCHFDDELGTMVWPVLLTAEEPKIDGWEFVARLDHSGGEIGTLVRIVPGKTLPECYHNADAKNCDHCKKKQYRRDTFVVREIATGIYKQVGSTCLKDFLGHDVKRIATLATLLGLAGEICRAATSNRYGEDRRYIPLDDYLATVASVIRERGWVSRSDARKFGKIATADIAGKLLTDKERLTDQDRETAEAALAWVETLTADQRAVNDYLHNIYVIAASGAIEHRSMGMAASIVGTYLREEAKKRPNVVTKLDNVQGIVALLDRATSLIKGAHINIRVEDRDLRLKIAKGGKFPGCVYVTEIKKGPDGRYPWLGRILTDGLYQPNKWGTTEQTQTAIRLALQAFNADPAGVAAQYGRLTGYCCFCSRKLTDERSVEVGYGQTCAGNYGLPWGNKPAAKPVKAKAPAVLEAPLIEGEFTVLEPC